MPPGSPPGDRAFTRRLLVACAWAAVAGLALGIPLAVVASEWRVAPLVAGGAVIVAGGVVAAVEDGRVQRRIDLLRRRR